MTLARFLVGRLSPLVVALAAAGSANALVITGITFGAGTPTAENVTLNGGTFVMPEQNVGGYHITASDEGSFYSICTEISQAILPLQNPYFHIANGAANGFTLPVALRVAQIVQAAGFSPFAGFSSGKLCLAKTVFLAATNLFVSLTRTKHGFKTNCRLVVTR